MPAPGPGFRVLTAAWPGFHAQEAGDAAGRLPSHEA